MAVQLVCRERRMGQLDPAPLGRALSAAHTNVGAGLVSFARVMALGAQVGQW